MRYLTPLLRAFEKRMHLFGDPQNNAFRLVNGDGDDLDGLTIDLYDRYILVQCFRENLLPQVKTMAGDLEKGLNTLPISIQGIMLKNRCKRAGSIDGSGHYKSMLLCGETSPVSLKVMQNGVTVQVDLINGQNTGVFLDMREVREKLSAVYPRAGSMLNLFCYTAVFSVHGLKNGIRSAINVDLSKTVLKRAKTNYTLNSLRVDGRNFIFGDASAWVRRFRKHNKKFDFIIFDPPTFARNRRKTFSVRSDYREYCQNLSSLTEGGYIFTAMNSAAVTRDEYIAGHPGHWRLEMFFNESSDFPWERAPYLKAGLWRNSARSRITKGKILDIGSTANR